MADETAQAFLTWKSLGSYGGASVAVVIVSNTFRTLTKWDSPWPAFISSLAVSFGEASVLGSLHSGPDYGLAFLNACLLFCGALGMEHRRPGCEDRGHGPARRVRALRSNAVEVAIALVQGTAAHATCGFAQQAGCLTSGMRSCTPAPSR